MKKGRPARFGIRIPFVIAFAATLLCVLGLSYGPVSAIFLHQAAERGINTRGLAEVIISGTLEKFVGLPQLVSTEPEVVELVLNPTDPNKVRTANWFLKGRQVLLNASDVYVMDLDGTTLAASNFERADSFIGENFSYRPYFQEAARGRYGRFFALGTTSGKRGYYFSAAIRVGSVVRGVIVFKIDLDPIEEAWRSEEYEIVVIDPNGVIFLSSREDWKYKSIRPLTTELLRLTSDTQRYADKVVTELPMAARGPHGAGTLVDVANNGESHEYLYLAEDMPRAGWTLAVLMNTASARAQTATLLTALGFLVCLLALLTVIQVQRHLRRRAAIRRDALAKEELERQVDQRTAALNVSNRQLQAEVVERESAEVELRRTQDDLVQAGKLAALGQVAAALSHEFNQPLTAIRNYSKNASVFIDRGNTSSAKSNLERIGRLTERMASISRGLRNFARKPTDSIGSVNLREAVDAVLEILAWRLDQSDLTLDVDASLASFNVFAEPVRLQQVLMNIISNAADACNARPASILLLHARDVDGAIELSLIDNGPGIPDPILPRIFDPFFTTKSVGSGLGLGLSISYNIVKDFGGDLKARNLPAGGAEFTVTLLPFEHQEAVSCSTPA